MYIYTGWKLDNKDQSFLKLMIIMDGLVGSKEERGGTTLAHHVTYQFGKGCEIPPSAKIEVQSVVHAPGELVCAVVAVDGTINRPDGGIYHVTLWVADGVRPVESNRILKEYGSDSFEYTKWDSSDIVLNVTPYGHPLN